MSETNSENARWSCGSGVRNKEEKMLCVGATHHTYGDLKCWKNSHALHKTVLGSPTRSLDWLLLMKEEKTQHCVHVCVESSCEASGAVLCCCETSLSQANNNDLSNSFAKAAKIHISSQSRPKHTHKVDRLLT